MATPHLVVPLSGYECDNEFDFYVLQFL